MSWETIETAVLAGDAERVVALCVVLPEAEREALAQSAADLFYRAHYTDERVRDAVAAAAFGLGPPDDRFSVQPEHLEPLVRSRPRAWRMAWLRHPYRHRRSAAKFQTLRSLQRSGDCDALEPERVTALMLSALNDPNVDSVALLAADAELHADAIWAPFAIERTWGTAMPAWEGAMIALAAAGTIPRGRLLDEWLELLARTDDIAAVEHLIGVHERRLKPSPDEIEERLDAYLRLLAGPVDTAAGFASGALTRLDRVRPLDAQAVLAPLASATRNETQAERAVALAARLLERAPEASALLTEALSHPAPAVREAASAAADPTWDVLEQAVEAGDAERVAELCLALDEPRRDTLAQRTLALWQRPSSVFSQGAVGRAAETARLGLCPVPDDERDRLDPPSSRLEALVRSRPRAWRDAWAVWAAQHGHRDRLAVWLTLRSLLREDLCDPPDSTCLMLQALARHDAPAELLRAHPETFADDVFAPFHVDRVEWSAPHEAWEAALLELVADRTVSRDRALDETLAALLAMPEPVTAKGLVSFHDRGLRPTVAELDARRDGYLRLLESDRDALVGFALAVVLRIDRDRPLDGRELLDRIEPAVGLRAKTHAKRAVTLIGRVLDREPALDPSALFDALGHPSAEVQAEAVAVLERHPQPGLAAYVEVVDPSLRARVDALAGELTSAPALRAVTVPSPRLGPRPRLRDPIVPVEDVEELLELASALLEGLEDPDEIERFVDGLSRLCDVPVPARRQKALLRRAAKGGQRPPPVARLCEYWLRRDGYIFFGGDGPTTAVHGRLVGLAGRLIAGTPDVLLSAPTHRGGFLDPDVLRDRLKRATAIDDHDLAQALLRVPDAEGFRARDDQPVTRDTLAVIAAPDAWASRRARKAASGSSPLRGCCPSRRGRGSCTAAAGRCSAGCHSSGPCDESPISPASRARCGAQRSTSTSTPSGWNRRCRPCSTRTSHSGPRRCACSRSRSSTPTRRACSGRTS